MNTTAPQINFQDILEKYLTLFPLENDKLKLLQEQISKEHQLNTRSNFVGHATASAYILDHDKRKVLLIKHNALGKLLQPGGHMEAEDLNPLETAKREAEEEVGINSILLKLYEILPGQPLIPLDIDTHFIPANPKKNEPGHFHHDFRYCFWLEGDTSKLKLQTEEVSEFDWVELSEITTNPQFKNVVEKIKELTLKNTPSKFFYEVISNNINSGKKLNSVIVTHILQDRPILLDALSRQTNLQGIIAKPNSIDSKTLEEVKQNYTVLDFTKESLKTFDEFNNYIKKIEGKVVLLDIGGYFASIINRLVDENPNKILGVVEDTENGHQKYEELSELKVPVVSVARSILKENEDYLVGQSIVFSSDSLLREYNRLLIFMDCGVLGYGKIGKSISANLQKMNIKPMVYDVIDSKRVKSINEGNKSPEKDEILEKSDIIFCATGNKSLDIHDFRKLKNGCFVASVTSADDEFNFDFLESEYEAEKVHEHIIKYTNTANYFYMLNSGNAINFLHGAVVGDFIFLVQSEILSGVNYLQDKNLKPGIHELPAEYKEKLSKTWLKYFAR